jgi:hypothetical protein
MAQLGQTLTNLTNYQTELNDPIISTVGHTGQYSDILNPPVISNVGHSGQCWRPIESTGYQYGDLLNAPALAPVATTGNYNSLSNTPNVVPNKCLVSVYSPPNGSFAAQMNTYSVGIVQTNVGVCYLANDLAAIGTSMIIPHGLPVATTSQTYIGMAQAFCPASGVDVSIICTIFYVAGNEFRVSCQQVNGDANGETHGADDMVISWQMSLINYPYYSHSTQPTLVYPNLIDTDFLTPTQGT